MKRIVKDTLILTAITLLAGFALAFVYQITKQPIARAEAAAELSAYESVFPDSTFEKLDPVPFDGVAAGVSDGQGVTVDAVAVVQREGKTVGYALKVTSPNGYGGSITVAVGVAADGSLTGISIISQSETAGLGARCASAEFTDQFKGITGGKVVFTKTGKSAPHEIDALSGATVTTRAVTAAVNTGLAYVQVNLAEGGDMV